MQAAIEDVRPSIYDTNFSSLVRSANDGLDVASSFVPFPAGYNAFDPHVVLDATFGSDNVPTAPSIGYHIEVHWHLDNTYYRSLVRTLYDGGHAIMYDDGESKPLDLTRETWRFCSESFVPPTASLEFPSDMSSVLSYMLGLFANKAFMPHESQIFLPYSCATLTKQKKTSSRRRSTYSPPLPFLATLTRFLLTSLTRSRSSAICF